MFYVEGLCHPWLQALIYDTDDNTKVWVSEDQLNEICKLGVDVEGIYPGKPKDALDMYLPKVDYSVCISHQRDVHLKLKVEMLYKCNLEYDGIGRLLSINFRDGIPDTGRLVLDDLTYAFCGVQGFLGMSTRRSKSSDFTLVFGEGIRYVNLRYVAYSQEISRHTGLHLIKYDLRKANKRVRLDFAQHLPWLALNCLADKKFYADCAYNMICNYAVGEITSVRVLAIPGVDQCFIKHYGSELSDIARDYCKKYSAYKGVLSSVLGMSFMGFLENLESDEGRNLRGVLYGDFPSLLMYYDLGGRNEMIFDGLKQLIKGMESL